MRDVLSELEQKQTHFLEKYITELTTNVCKQLIKDFDSLDEKKRTQVS